MSSSEGGGLGRVGAERLPASVEAKLHSTDERILAEVAEVYGAEGRGLLAASQRLGLRLRPPRRKVTVLLLGNHSAGKSSFINWYVEEHVQRTGVAIETQGFALVTSGRRRESLKGPATLHLFPHLRHLADLPGVLEYVTTEVCPSKRKKFPLVTFVDSPGLVDGHLGYPFDVDAALEWLGAEAADLVLVFFDPIGQALCRRTLRIVDAVNARAPEKLRFFLSKADEAGGEADRQRVLMQIVQELCRFPGLNKAGLDMPTIFLPDEGVCRPGSRALNQIGRVTGAIEACIAGCVQKTLEELERDAGAVSGAVDGALARDEERRSTRRRRRCRAVLASAAWALLCGAVVAGVLGPDRSPLHLLLPPHLVQPTHRVLDAVPAALPEAYATYAAGLLILLLILLPTFALRAFRPVETLSRVDKKLFKAFQSFAENDAKKAKARLYKEYLEQSIVDIDQ